MIELIVDDRCSRCNLCVTVCPTNVLALPTTPGAPPVIARQEDCQTCFLCELYCQADAIYVAPDIEKPTAVVEADIVASGLLGHHRRNAGWDEWGADPNYRNEFWRMGELFGRGLGVDPTTGRP
jgi:NAD-dependent dihydropyrimidine dehydrogenase PreA subunit